MSKIWSFMILISLGIGIFSGRITTLNQVLVSVGQETLDFALPMMASTCFFSGVMYVAKEGGLMKGLEKLLGPFFRLILPDLKNNPEALQYISANIVINMFGLGFAATPSGLKAMQLMQQDNPNKDTATRSMITFLVLNTAGVTILSTMIVSLRSQFNAAVPTDYMPYAIIATSCACVAGLLMDRWCNYRGK